LRRTYFLPHDLWAAIRGDGGTIRPPKGLIYTGGGDFIAHGEQALAYFRRHAGLLPRHQVLDVGSGIGRIAIPLTGYLDSSGSYEGFDVIRTGVDWCTRNITARHPNFLFRYVSLDNDLYRSDGGDAARFTFPYPDGRFDLVVVNSVFTHLVPEEAFRYLAETFRVLRSGGACYATFFLYDKDTVWSRDFPFPHDFGDYRLMDTQVRSANVAFRQDALLTRIRRMGFVVRRLSPGAWKGTEQGVAEGFQDILLLEKPEAV
jgi:SAM-dependent methyltransferase